jgi:hypothetical protein
MQIVALDFVYVVATHFDHGEPAPMGERVHDVLYARMEFERACALVKRSANDHVTHGAAFPK